jgi:uncharacterized membrane protein YkgB
MNYIIKLCNRWGLLESDIDYHLIRASMVLIFLLFGYQKWFQYEANTLIPFISKRPTHLLDVSGFRNQRRKLVSGSF